MFRYTPIVLGLAGALGVYKGFDQLLVVIVAGCPCALLGAAPFVQAQRARPFGGAIVRDRTALCTLRLVLDPARSVQAATLTLLAGRHRLLVKHATTLEV